MDGPLRHVTAHSLHIQKVYTSLGTSSMHILLLSAHACMHFAWELLLETQCVHLVYTFRTTCNQNAYMHEQKNLVYALWQEVPKLVYTFWTCKPVIYIRFAIYYFPKIFCNMKI